jgi:hypothetical protein
MMKVKDFTKEKAGKPDSLFDKLKKNNSLILRAGDVQKLNDSNHERQREINKEIIRRLRIQNKKLIEQVVKFKEEIKKTRFNKTQVLNHINELLKLINQ